MIAFAFLCSFVGAAWFALAYGEHWAQAVGHGESWGANPARARWLRRLGAAALAASLALCFGQAHASIAVLVWLMSISAASLVVALALAWCARVLAPLVRPLARGRA